MPKSRALWLLHLVGLFLLVPLLAASPAAAADGDVRFETTIDGRALADVDANDPLELRSGEIEIAVRVENQGAEATMIRYVRLSGEAAGIDFFSYVSRVDIALAAGGTDERVFLLDVGDLGDLATGLLPAELALLDEDRGEISDQPFIADVQGSIGSVYGTFGLAITIGTALLLAFVLFRLFANRLPVNRWRRATYFGAPGLGVGLTITFGLSVLRLASPTATVWLVLIVAGGVSGIGLGYFTPTPYDQSLELDELDELQRLEAREDIAESVLADRARERSPTQEPGTVPSAGPTRAKTSTERPSPSVSKIAHALPGYEIGDELGRGGMGVVLSGRHRQLGRDVAIKQLPSPLVDDPAVRARFVGEARALASLDHPHIVPIYDFVEQDGLCLLVMERLPGGTVWDRYTSHGLGNAHSCAIAMLTCAGLDYAHSRGVLHRDVKPENLLFSGEGMVKITDFGIAKVVGGGETFATSAGDILGTPVYMAPEQAEGGQLGPSADVYATGMMLYELLAGTLPYSEDGGALAIVFRHVNEDPRPLSEAAPDVPPPLAEVVMQAIARSPSDRPSTAEEFGVAIGDAARRAWGPGWMDPVGMPVSMSGPILRSTEAAVPDEAPTGGPSEPSPVDGDPRATRARSDPLPSVTDSAPPFGAPIAPGEDGPDGYPASREPHTVVRPSIAIHPGGAQAADLGPDDLVPVSDALQPPPTPLLPGLAALVLLVATVALAAVGVDRDGTTPERGEVQVEGVDPSVEAVSVDFSEDVTVRIRRLPAGAEDATRARLDYSVVNVSLPSSSTRDLEPVDGGLGAALPSQASRYLAVGRIDAQLVFLGPGDEELTTSRFTVEPEAAPTTTVPGIAVIALALLVLGYAETFLRPMRRKAQRKVGGFIGMAVVGAAFGAVVAVLAWAFFAEELTTATLVAGGALGMCTGIALAAAAARFGRRRRVMRLATSLELRRSSRTHR